MPIYDSIYLGVATFVVGFFLGVNTCDASYSEVKSSSLLWTSASAARCLRWSRPSASLITSFRQHEISQLLPSLFACCVRRGVDRAAKLGAAPVCVPLVNVPPDLNCGHNVNPVGMWSGLTELYGTVCPTEATDRKSVV